MRVNPFTLVKLPRETVERFLALFATTPAELASELAACELPWQMLPLQTRPLVRIGDDVVVLDEPFLLEAVTTGLYWRVSDHVRMSDPEAWRPWSVAYAEMIEALAEELVEAPRMPGCRRSTWWPRSSPCRHCHEPCGTRQQPAWPGLPRPAAPC